MNPTSDPIVVVDYDPAWPALFAALRAPVAAALGVLTVAVEHVGSTAVPGLAAKPIIDLDVAIPSVSALDTAIERLVALGYYYNVTCLLRLANDLEAGVQPLSLAVGSPLV